MNLNQIENCLNAIFGPENKERDEAYQILQSYSQDINFSNLLAQIITSDNYPIFHRVLCLSIFIHFNVVFPPDLFSTLLPFLNTPNVPFINQLSQLLSKKITTEEQVVFLLNTASNSNLEYIHGILSLLTDFLSFNKLCAEKIIFFCANIISETQQAPLDSPDIDIILKIRGLASEAINLTMLPVPDSDQKFESNPSFCPLLKSLLSLPLNDQRNINVVQNIFGSSLRHLSETDLFNICFQQFQILSKMAPLSGSLIFLASKLSNRIRIIYEYAEDDDEISFDPRILVQCAISCSILNSDVIDRWRMNINEFFIENINPDIDDDDYNDDNFVSLRENCVSIAMDFVNIAVSFCIQIMRESPYHMETSFFFLSEILPNNSKVEFDIACPSDEDPILYGQYINLIAHLNLDIDSDLLEEYIEMNNDFLIYFIAKAIFNSEENPTFLSYLVPVTMKLLSMRFMYDTPECAAHLEFITYLIEKNKQAFIPFIDQLNNILMQILQIVLPIRDATLQIITIFSIFSKIPELSLPLQSFMLPFICEMLSNSNGNSYLLLTALDFMTMLFSPLSNSLLPINAIQPFFDSFMKIITDSLMAEVNSLNSANYQIIPIDGDSMISIMSLLAFFARSYSPSPFASPVCKWLVNALMSFDRIKNKMFRYLPSCVVHIFLNNNNHDDLIQLVKALYLRLANNANSQSFKFSLALSFSTLALIDFDSFMKYTEECGIDIRIFLPTIPQILCESSEPNYVDDLIILAALFKFGDLHVFDIDEEKPMTIVSLRSLSVVFNFLFASEELDDNNLDDLVQVLINKKSTKFNKDDPFFLNHPFRTMKFREFLKNVLPPFEKIPKSFQDDIKRIFSLR